MLQGLTIIAVYWADPDALETHHLGKTVGSGLNAVVSTSVLTGPAADAWHASNQRYMRGESVDFNVDFEDVKFGYWGANRTMSRISESFASTELGTNAKSRKFMNLGEANWLTALAYSPAEPGLASALVIADREDGAISAGGWSDLHPTMVLRAMGCENIIYVTRVGDDSGFGIGVATHLGMTDADHNDIYNLDNPESSYSLAVAEADAVWCTNWNDFEGTQVQAVFDDAYFADMESTSEYFTRSESPYENISSNLGRRGCSPGAPPAAE